MKKIVLTGANGFVGRNCVVSLLKSGYEVHAFSRQPIKSHDVNWHEVDLFDTEKLEFLMSRIKATHLLHFAWDTRPGIYWSSVENFHWVKASLDLLHLFALNGGHRIVMAGTCAEYDWKYGLLFEDESMIKPSTTYGICKNAMRMLLPTFCERYDISCAWGRIFHLYGPHEPLPRLVPSVVTSLLDNVPALCTEGRQLRDFSFVEDVADAFVHLLNSTFSGAVNIGSGNVVRVKDLVSKIAEKLGRSDLIRIGSLQSQPSDPLYLVPDLAKLNEDVGWKSATTLDIGLDRTIDWWSSQYKINK